ncbi:hypothetical protein [Clostridium chrysemydis]|uniref:hypothetical protein n=1 Tax=Clostridium chrysemydis TaxID=2665504 RepID=UPI00188317B4|nr:hypothetical protein [Clostridium chrysemydis]
MRTKLIEKPSSRSPKDIDIDNMCSDVEVLEYECPCGKGKIVEEHDYTPGFREHDVNILCNSCSKKYTLDLKKGVRNWELIEK